MFRRIIAVTSAIAFITLPALAFTDASTFSAATCQARGDDYYFEVETETEYNNTSSGE
jgi:ABC-type uncharacterized transport system YnjBCD substrate-binding protein